MSRICSFLPAVHSTHWPQSTSSKCWPVLHSPWHPQRHWTGPHDPLTSPSQSGRYRWDTGRPTNAKPQGPESTKTGKKVYFGVSKKFNFSKDVETINLLTLFTITVYAYSNPPIQEYSAHLPDNHISLKFKLS